MIILLSDDKQSVTIEDSFEEVSEVTLNVGDVIDFKGTASQSGIYSGMIQSFTARKDMDGAIWMTMKETTGKLDDESISILNWKNYINAGAIKF